MTKLFDQIFILDPLFIKIGEFSSAPSAFDIFAINDKRAGDLYCTFSEGRHKNSLLANLSILTLWRVD